MVGRTGEKPCLGGLLALRNSYAEHVSLATNIRRKVLLRTNTSPAAWNAQLCYDAQACDVLRTKSRWFDSAYPASGLTVVVSVFGACRV